MTSPAWTYVAKSTDIAEGCAIEIVVGEQIIAVFRNDGQLFALDGMCAHQGGPIAQGEVAHGCVTCPWHGWQYDLATGIQTVNQKPLQRVFEIRENDGEVQVSV